MIVRFPRLAKAAALAALSFPQLAAAQGFTSADVLAWPVVQQDSLFQTSVTMIGFVAAETGGHSEIARCIDGWYWKEGKADSEKNASIRDAMERFPEYHPQMVILAFVEKACGKFNPS